MIKTISILLFFNAQNFDNYSKGLKSNLTKQRDLYYLKEVAFKSTVKGNVNWITYMSACFIKNFL